MQYKRTIYAQGILIVFAIILLSLFAPSNTTQAATDYHRETALTWAQLNNRNNGAANANMNDPAQRRYSPTYIALTLQAGGIRLADNLPGNVFFEISGLNPSGPIGTSQNSLVSMTYITTWMQNTLNQGIWEFRPVNELEPGDFVMFTMRNVDLNNPDSWAEPRIYSHGNIIKDNSTEQFASWNREFWGIDLAGARVNDNNQSSNVVGVHIIDNRAPNPASNPRPADGAINNISMQPIFSWTGSDPDGDTLTYDFLLGTSSGALIPIATNLPTASFTPDTVLTDYVPFDAMLGSYTWQVITRDESGEETASPEWTFVPNQVPVQSTYIEPLDNSDLIRIPVTFRWNEATDPDDDPLAYILNINNGNRWIAINPGGTTNTELTVGWQYLDSDTIISWRVDVTDGLNTTQGEVWQFTTVPERCNNIYQIPLQECVALDALYSSTSGNNWVDNVGWNDSNLPCDDWYGITCAGTTEPLTVTEVSLAANGLNGIVPVELDALIGLEILRLNGRPVSLPPIPEREHNLTLEDPTMFASMTQLREVILRSAGLSGSLPTSLFTLPNLTKLWLADNAFIGSFPDVVTTTALVELDVQNNQISGSLPASLGQLPQLRVLNINKNNLTGAIPDSFGNLTRLERLYAENNCLTSLPSTIGGMVTIFDVDLSQNCILSEIPTSINQLRSLQELQLDRNGVQGYVTDTLTTLPLLESVRLEYNRLYPIQAGTTPFATDTANNWMNTQTVPPLNLTAAYDEVENVIDLTWTPIPYTQDTGRYNVYITNGLEEFTLSPSCNAEISSKTDSECKIAEVEPGNSYTVYMETFTDAHTNQQNALTSLATEFIYIAIPPENDTPETATVIDALPFITDVDNSGADASGSTLFGECGVTVTNTLHYSLNTDLIATANLDDNLVLDIDTAGSASDTVITLYTGTPGNWIPVASSCNDTPTWLPEGAASEISSLVYDGDDARVIVTLPNIADQTYYIAVGGTGELAMGRVHIAVDSAPFTGCETTNTLPIAACNAVVDLFNDTGGDINWYNAENWLVTDHVCTAWYGIGCESNQVDRLLLGSNGLQNSLPTSLINLSQVDTLLLHHNNLTGIIPTLPNANVIRIDGNQFAGTLGQINATNAQFGFNLFDSADPSMISAYPNWLSTMTVTPANFDVIPGTDSIQLIWDPIAYTDNGFYRIYYENTANISDAGFIDVIKTDSVEVLQGLVSGDSYTFTIETRSPRHDGNPNNDLISPLSNPVTVTLDGSGVFLPGDLQATNVTSNTVSLTWTHPGVVDAFFIERSSDDDQNWVDVSDTGTTETIWEDTDNVLCETNYQYRIRAYNASASPDSAYSRPLHVQTGLCVPVDVVVTPLDRTSMTVSWNTASTLADGTLIYRRLSGALGNWEELASLAVDDTSYIDTQVECGAFSYDYALATFMGEGDDRVFSDVVEITIPAPECSEADVVLENIPSHQRITVDHELVYSITVTNNGPDETDAVEITLPLPVGVGFVEVSNTTACTHNAGTVTCNYGVLANLESVTFMVTGFISAETLGDLTTTTTVTHAQDDPNTANNTVVSTVTAVEPGIELLAPLGMINNAYGNPQFEWYDVRDALSYTLRVTNLDTDRDVFFSVLADEDVCDSSVCQIDLTTLDEAYRLTNGRYEWTLFIDYNASASASAPTTVTPAQFTLSTDPPDVVTLQPTTNIDRSKPMLNWILEGTAVNSTNFTVYLAPANDLGSPLINETFTRAEVCGDTESTTCYLVSPVDLSDNTSYELYIANSGPGGVTTSGLSGSAYVGPEKFTMNLVIPSPIAPNNVIDTPKGNPIFTWQDLDGLEYYYVYVGTQTGTQIIYEVLSDSSYCDGTVCQFDATTLREAYRLQDGAYIFYVRGWLGNQLTPWSDGMSFIVQSDLPDVVTRITPAMDAVEPDHDVTFSWQEVNEAYAYELVLTEPGNANSYTTLRGLVGEDVTCTSGVCTWTYQLPPINGQWTYYLRAINTAGAGQWSAGGAADGYGAILFTVPTAIPNVVTKVSPVAAQTINDSYIVFEWVHDEDASVYELYLVGPNDYVLYEPYTVGSDVLCVNLCTLSLPAPSVGEFIWYIRAGSEADWGPWALAGADDDGDATFTVSETLSGVVTKIAPLQGVSTNDLDVTFVWEHDPEATVYEISILGSDDYLNHDVYTVDADVLCSINCELDIALPENGDYTWYIRGGNIAGWGLWSAGSADDGYGATTFTVNQTLPSVITKVQPELNDTINVLDIVFSWQEDTLATHYRLYVVGPDNYLHDNTYSVNELICIDGVCSRLVELPANGTYTWYLVGINEAGKGRWSVGHENDGYGAVEFMVAQPVPDVVVKTGPLSNTVLTDLDVTFRWKWDEETSLYQVVITGANDFVHNEVYQRDVDLVCGFECVLDLPITLPGNGEYTWYVRGINTAGGGLWDASEPVSYGGIPFTITQQTPQVVVKTAPLADQVIDTLTVPFSWQYDPYSDRYEVYVHNTTNDFAHYHIYTVGTDIMCETECVFNLTVPGNDTYTWYVRGINDVAPGLWDANEINGDYGAVSFTVAYPVPDAITKSVPANGTIVEDFDMTFSWLHDANATQYEIYIQGPSGFEHHEIYTVGTDIACTTECILSVTVLENGNYTWYLRGRSAGGPGLWDSNEPNTYGGVSFTVALPLPNPPVLISPTDDAIIYQTNLPTFTWNPSETVTYYRLVVTNGVGQTIFDEWMREADICANVTCIYQFTTPIAYGRYTWKVQGYNPSGIGEETAEWSFLTLSLNSQPLMIQVEDGRVARTGTWTTQPGDGAVGAIYLQSTTSTNESLTTTFVGTQVDVVYIAGPQYGTFVVEIDGVPLGNITANATQISFGQVASFNGLSEGEHTLRIVPLDGSPVAIDALIVSG